MVHAGGVVQSNTASGPRSGFLAWLTYNQPSGIRGMPTPYLPESNQALPIVGTPDGTDIYGDYWVS